MINQLAVGMILSINRAGVLLILGLLFLDLIVWAGAWRWLDVTRKQFEAKASIQADNLSLLLHSDFNGRLESIDRTLSAVAHEIERQETFGELRPELVEPVLSQHLFVLPSMSGMRVVNAVGEIVFGASGESQVFVTDREYFQQLRDDPKKGMVISHPVLGRISKTWDIVFARAIHTPQGEFAGIVTLVLPISSLNERFATLSNGSTDIFAIFNDQSLRFITRYPEGVIAPGEPLIVRKDAPMFVARRISRLSGTFVNVAPQDGVLRSYGYRCMATQPICILVGVGLEAYLAPWVAERRMIVGSVALFTLFTLLLWYLTYRAWCRQLDAMNAEQAAYQVRDAEHRFNQVIIDESPIAVVTRDIEGVITLVNEAAEKLLGWPADALVGQTLENLLPDMAAEIAYPHHKTFTGETVVDREITRSHRDRHPVNISATQAPLRDASGAVTGYLTMAMDITRRKDAEAKVEYLASRDALTGLPNWSMLRDRFEHAKGSGGDQCPRLVFVMLNLNNFKTINESLGHAAGDAVLRVVAKRLTECVRDSDTVSRQGGDEFLLLLIGMDGLAQIQAVLHELKSSVSCVMNIQGEEIYTSATMGVALYPEDGEDFETILRKAAAAMSRAKGDGRGSCRFFDDGLDREATASLRTEVGLRRALAKGEFELHYQPQIDLRSGLVQGVEALLRWRHPEQGLVLPGQFIQIAEQSGLIVPIGEWVISECCRQGQVWREAGIAPVRIAFNLSAVQFSHSDVEGTIRRALIESGFDPNFLELELTESVLIRNTEQVLNTVQRLKQLGVMVSVDDFGTGYSSLAYLQRFDVDKLKIDQAFVRDLCQNTNDKTIVRAIIQMAHALNLRTIAEGVEDEATLACLQQLECDEVQGYLIAKPMQEEQLATFIREYSNGWTV
ncbi:EAL domain-containing protein [Pseudomonas sp. B21-010]|uniref:bifunctional diguanylate cyclase/phosphodiesterase n=1 Tax=Pseudomonas sp. B21-010 TaxID=2895471 RepID=UPI002160FAA0|nr:EAL domain-containing protein [Pseudomonas sp. B21-010]UVM59336.1 EAL domain-containing protein [Pseudomonas sp. B21-010]